MVPVQDILKVVGWSSEKTFTQFYHKDLENSHNDRFTRAILQ